jgi:hypothetical protein
MRWHICEGSQAPFCRSQPVQDCFHIEAILWETFRCVI